MASITVKHVRAAFAATEKALAYHGALDRMAAQYGPGKLALECWSPGDGVTRYRVNWVLEGSGAEYQPLGSGCWLGASAAYDALWAIQRALGWMLEPVKQHVLGATASEVTR